MIAPDRRLTIFSIKDAAADSRGWTARLAPPTTLEVLARAVEDAVLLEGPCGDAEVVARRLLSPSTKPRILIESLSASRGNPGAESGHAS